jgi:hypothetical protein
MDFPWEERTKEAKQKVVDAANEIPYPPDDLLGLRRRQKNGTLSDEDKERIYTEWCGMQDAFERIHKLFFCDPFLVKWMHGSAVCSITGRVAAANIIDLQTIMIQLSQGWYFKVLRELWKQDINVKVDTMLQHLESIEDLGTSLRKALRMHFFYADADDGAAASSPMESGDGDDDDDDDDDDVNTRAEAAVMQGFLSYLAASSRM